MASLQVARAAERLPADRDEHEPGLHLRVALRLRARVDGDDLDLTGPEWIRNPSRARLIAIP